MTHRYCIRTNPPDGGENVHPCPICRKEVPTSAPSCPGCGYTFPVKARRSRLHHDSLIHFPQTADPGAGKESIFLL